MQIEIRMEWEGRMGNDMTKAYLVFADGKEVGYSKRKWLAKAIGDAIADGRIEASGDTTSRLTQWAYDNDRALFERIDKLRAGY